MNNETRAAFPGAQLLNYRLYDSGRRTINAERVGPDDFS